MHLFSFPRQTLLCLALAYAECVPAASAGTPHADVQAIVRAWKQRQDQIRTFRFAWREELVRSKGSVFDPAIDRYMSGTQPIPAQQVTQEYTGVLLVDGLRMRNERDGPFYSQEAQAFVPVHSVSAYDGEQSKSYRGYDPTNGNYPQGRVFAIQENYDSSNTELWALLLAMRPLMRTGADDRGRSYSLLTTTRIVDRSTCLELRRRVSGDTIETLCVDPDRDFVITLSEKKHDGTVAFHHRISYAQMKDGVWIPRTWQTSTFRSDGTVYDTRNAVVTSSAINIPLRKEDFQLDFPVGTWVVNRVTGESYIQREGGERRIVLPSERGGYQVFLATETGEAVPGGRARRWVLVGTLGLVLCAIAVLLLRKTVARRAP